MKIVRIGSKLARSQAEINAMRNVQMGPKLHDMARGLIKSTMQHAKDGFNTVSKETHEKRLAICAECPQWEPSRYMGMGRCKQCGCSGIKLTWRTSVCPLAKWGGEE